MSSDLDNWEPMSDEHVASYAAMLPWEMQCNDYSGQTVWRLAVEIERLRAEVADWQRLRDWWLRWQEARRD